MSSFARWWLGPQNNSSICWGITSCSADWQVKISWWSSQPASWKFTCSWAIFKSPMHATYLLCPWTVGILSVLGFATRTHNGLWLQRIKNWWWTLQKLSVSRIHEPDTGTLCGMYCRCCTTYKLSPTTIIQIFIRIILQYTQQLVSIWSIEVCELSCPGNICSCFVNIRCWVISLLLSSQHSATTNCTLSPIIKYVYYTYCCLWMCETRIIPKNTLA